MQEFPRMGAAPNGATARQAKPFATFKLPTPRIALMRKRQGAGPARTAANVNRIGVISAPEDASRPDRA